MGSVISRLDRRAMSRSVGVNPCLHMEEVPIRSLIMVLWHAGTANVLIVYVAITRPLLSVLLITVVYLLKRPVTTS